MVEATYEQQRLHNWCQTPAAHLSGSEQAPDFIERMGIATLYPASPEFPNLFSAYVGDPNAKTDSGWDTPSGELYTWRWTLGRQAVAYYSALIRRRPTWISWSLLPSMLRLCGELRSPHELYHTGQLSAPAYQIIEALEAATEPLATSELREQAGFPRGTASRNLYLKAVEELEALMLLAKIFPDEGNTMYHVLVRQHYPEHVASAERLSQPEALRNFLHSYLPQAVYANPKSLAKDLKLPLSTLNAAFEELLSGQQVVQLSQDGKNIGYHWRDTATVNR
ncbi:hypothetical protein KDK_49130 [Dictyobacter kobayashii]|uniref:Uncharacterized protein n=2 Tax=Dictyobacter kobayashii TaxID=2014872 RepID=A0A402APM0_9CHLR|nr:hypothetical protein KDK_49130 [Dictyobacter kobayashii]